MRRKRIVLEKVKCERCGKEIYTSSRSALGSAGDVFKKKFGIVCESCITPEELRELLKAQMGIIQGMK